MESVVGAIFPISAQYASRIFDEGRTVFAKFTKMANFTKKSKIIFYLTKEKTLIGEGIIKNVCRTNSDGAWSQFGGSLFLNEREYKQYISWSTIEGKSRTTTEITVFVLRNIRKYKKGIFFRNITPSGCYVTDEDYTKIRGLL